MPVTSQPLTTVLSFQTNKLEQHTSPQPSHTPSLQDIPPPGERERGEESGRERGEWEGERREESGRERGEWEGERRVGGREEKGNMKL